MEAEKIRRRILDEHTRISGWLAELEHLAGRLRTGEPGIVDVVAERARNFRTFFLSHLDLEERILAPALRRAGGESTAIADRLLEEHAAQRLLVDRFASGTAAESKAPVDVAKAVDDFVADIRADMRAEESVELDPTLLFDPEGSQP